MKKRIWILCGVLAAAVLAAAGGLLAANWYKFQPYEPIPALSAADFSGCAQVDIEYYNPASGKMRQARLSDADLIRRLTEEAEALRGRREPCTAAQYTGGTLLCLRFSFPDGREPLRLVRSGVQLRFGDAYYGTEEPYFGGWLLTMLYEEEIPSQPAA